MWGDLRVISISLTLTLTQPMALITPYKRPLGGMAEQRFNTHHSRARSIVERAFGMMKTRFRCIFLEALEVHSEFVPKVYVIS